DGPTGRRCAGSPRSPGRSPEGSSPESCRDACRRPSFVLLSSRRERPAELRPLVGTEVGEAVDEDRRRAGGTACKGARAIGLDPVEMDMRFELLPEPLDMEPDLVVVAFEVDPLERLLTVEEEIVHGPEP